MIKIYTDGGARPNPGFGGFGVYSEILQLNYFESLSNVTNNQMELAAVIFAYDYAEKHNLKEKIIIYTDSNYVVQGVNSWKAKWKKENWKNVKNKELWILLDDYETKNKHISLEWIKGHNGELGNEIADCLATQGVESKSNNTIIDFISSIELNRRGFSEDLDKIQKKQNDIFVIENTIEDELKDLSIEVDSDIYKFETIQFINNKCVQYKMDTCLRKYSVVFEDSQLVHPNTTIIKNKHNNFNLYVKKSSPIEDLIDEFIMIPKLKDIDYQKELISFFFKVQLSKVLGISDHHINIKWK